MVVSHLDMFYNTRGSIAVSNSDPTNNPHTELKSVPEACEIRYEDYPNRSLDCNDFEAPNEKGYETARFLIERAILDPDATVVPT